LNRDIIAVGVTPFFNYFPNYFFFNQSPEYDRLYGNGNQVFYYTQSEVLRYGGEVHAHYRLFRSVQFGFIGEFVHSEQLSGAKKGFTLPFSPPATALFNVKFLKPDKGAMENLYLSLDYKIAAPQNNIVPPEETTPGYQEINIGLGCTIHLFSQRADITFLVRNLLNSRYYNHNSYYRIINIPEPGRNVIVNISAPISGKDTKNNYVEPF